MQPNSLSETVARALTEDVGDGDVTTAVTVPEGTLATARITQKAPGTIFGLDAVEAVFETLSHGHVTVSRLVDEGEWQDGGPVLDLAGPAAALLTGERTALNFLQRLSGIATLTAQFVQKIEGTGARMLNTRKTTPGLRVLEKAAVVAGGGTNLRIGLFDMALIKENHAAMAGGVGAAVRAALDRAPGFKIEVECRSLAEVEEALAAGSPMILLDNMTPVQLREAVAVIGGRAETEASGNVSLGTVREIAETGVDFISAGALTHSAPALDVSLILAAQP